MPTYLKHGPTSFIAQVGWLKQAANHLYRIHCVSKQLHYLDATYGTKHPKTIMHRILTTLLCLFFLQTALLCQPTEAPVMEGTVRYLVTHNWTKKLQALTYMSKQVKERSAYMWGSRSEWRLYSVLHFTPTQTKYEDSEEDPDKNDQGYSWRKEMFFVSRNLTENTEYDGLEVNGKKYIVSDSIHCQKWKILNDLKEVAGHLCMNASWEDTIKQQKVMAWFALDIPHTGGPERYCGLPGMILEININDGAMVATADRIEAKTLVKELDLPKKVKGKMVSEVEYQDILHKFISEQTREEQPYFWFIRY